MTQTAMAKRPINLSVNAELLKEARALGLNLSQVLEESLAKIADEKQRDQWLAEIKEAAAIYNRHIERHGVFSKGKRKF
jgi:antitoxin CcdA